MCRLQRAVSASNGLPNGQIFAILPTASDIWLGSNDGLILQQSGSWQSVHPTQRDSHTPACRFG